MKDIFEIKDGTIHNHAGLEIIERDGNLYVSANEVNEILKDTNYEVSEYASFFQGNIPLFKDKEMCDLLINIYSLNLFIKLQKYKQGIYKIPMEKSLIDCKSLPIRNKAMDFRDIDEIKAMVLRISEDFYNSILKLNNKGSYDKYSFTIFGIIYYLKYFRLKKRDWTIDDLALEIRKDLKLEADN